MWLAGSGLCKLGGNRPKEAVNQIRTLIDKARSVAQQQEEKNKGLDDTLKKQ